MCRGQLVPVWYSDSYSLVQVWCTRYMLLVWYEYVCSLYTCDMLRCGDVCGVWRRADCNENDEFMYQVRTCIYEVRSTFLPDNTWLIMIFGIIFFGFTSSWWWRKCEKTGKPIGCFYFTIAFTFQFHHYNQIVGGFILSGILDNKPSFSLSLQCSQFTSI